MLYIILILAGLIELLWAPRINKVKGCVYWEKDTIYFLWYNELFTKNRKWIKLFQT